ncbi:hypothetical protein HN747_00435 [archaeon]|jgi:hypothetical protein|nr:hypothetical protein [archaeon]
MNKKSWKKYDLTLGIISLLAGLLPIITMVLMVLFLGEIKEKLNAVFIVILSLIPILVSWKIIHHKEWAIWILLLNQTVAITFILGFGGFVLNLPLLGLCVYWLISESKFLQH